MAAQKVILAYGDSLTYGYDPSGIGRLPYEDRWPTVLERGLSGAARVIAESKRMGAFYKRRADEYGTGFFDASTVAQPDARDGVHLDAANTRAIGEALVPIVKQVLGL